jgi:RimJ/RimL family protein N-acetyltransferase
LGLHRIDGRAFEDAESVIRMYEQLGFVREGTLRDASCFQGRYRNMVLVGVLEDEWRAREGRLRV